LVKLLIKEDINLNNLTIKKNKINSVIATYLKSNHIEESQLEKIIEGVISKLPQIK
jgi:hypothetical protein